MKYFLDTNVIIDISRKKNEKIINHLLNTNPNDIFIPSIVIAELEFGARHSKDYKNNFEKIQKIIKPFKIVQFTELESYFYGIIRQQLTASGTVIGSNDMLIAATALANDGIIVTHNVREFSRINDLKVEDWTE